jgi:hypothetical protein
MIAEGGISKLLHSIAKDIDVSPKEIIDAMRELHRYIVLVERKCDEVEIQANRRRFF